MTKRIWLRRAAVAAHDAERFKKAGNFGLAMVRARDALALVRFAREAEF